MRVHEAVIVVAMLFAGSRLAGGMARRDTTVGIRGPVVAARHGEVADARQNPCARTAEYQFRCDPARPRALDGSSADRANGVAQGSARR